MSTKTALAQDRV